jgi:hypothetical protein
VGVILPLPREFGPSAAGSQSSSMVSPGIEGNRARVESAWLRCGRKRAWISRLLELACTGRQGSRQVLKCM